MALRKRGKSVVTDTSIGLYHDNISWAILTPPLTKAEKRRIFRASPESRKAQAKYEASPKRQAARDRYNAKKRAERAEQKAKRQKIKKTRTSQKKYKMSKKGKAAHNAANARYRRSAKGKLTRQMYLKARRKKYGVYTISNKPCKAGHVGRRYASNNRCVECLRLQRQEQAEYAMLYQRARRARLKDDPTYKRHRKEQSQAYRDAHPYADRTSSERHARREAIFVNTLNVLREEGYRI